MLTDIKKGRVSKCLNIDKYIKSMIVFSHHNCVCTIEIKVLRKVLKQK